MIYYGKQSISEDDISAVVDVLRSELITQGPVAYRFEKAMCDYTGALHSIACSSGTAALHVACLSLGVGAGDIVWTSPNSFVASANCALYCGAEVDFVDIDLETLNISVPLLREKLERAYINNTLPKVLIIVHFAGSPCDMASIKLLADHYNIFVIEDACHALGASYREEKVGSCQYSDITVFSFHPVKSITSGEGGMLMSNNDDMVRKARMLCNQGITRDSSRMLAKNEDEYFYEQHVLGFNYRLTDLQAALGLSQLRRLDQFIEKRQAIAAYYYAQLNDLGFEYQQLLPEAQSAHHLHVIKLTETHIPYKRKIYKEMKLKGVVLNCHYIPIHLQPFFKARGFMEGDYPNAEKYYRRALSLPIYPDLSESELSLVVNELSKCVKVLKNI